MYRNKQAPTCGGIALLLLCLAGCESHSNRGTRHPSPTKKSPETKPKLESPAEHEPSRASAHDDGEDSSRRDLSPSAHFEGRILIPREERHSRKQADSAEERLTGQVIRNEKAFEQLVCRLPDHEIVKSHDPPPNEDPLLDEPKIGFDRNALVVATCPYLECDLEVRPSRHESGAPVVIVKQKGKRERPPDVLIKQRACDRESGQKGYGVGNYRAVVVPDPDDQVEVEIREK